MNQKATLVNCPRCGKLFVRTFQKMCPECVKEIDEEFIRCRDYIRENPQTRMKELSEATGVKVWQIVQFIIEGRLVLTKDNPNLFYTCERCGKNIQSGRLCKTCAQQFTEEAKKIVQKDEKPESHVRQSYRIYQSDE